jgi:hypothetical protein
VGLKAATRVSGEEFTRALDAWLTGLERRLLLGARSHTETPRVSLTERIRQAIGA